MLALIIAVILSLEADFTQTKTSALMSEPQVSTGHLAYRALFKAVNITMDERQEVAKRVELIEKNGDVTLIEFKNVVKQ